MKTENKILLRLLIVAAICFGIMVFSISQIIDMVKAPYIKCLNE